MKIHPKCNYKTEESMNYCSRCGSMINETFQSDFYMREYNTESNTARYFIPRRDLVVFFLLNFSLFLCTLFIGFTLSQPVI